MKRNQNGLALFIWVSVMLSAMAVYGQQREDTNRTLSPYFFVKSEDPGIDRLPLKSTKAEVRVVGVIADVTVTQVYRNEGKNPLEAIYIFPASMRAAVYGMKMTIGERTIVATIKEREEARRDYEQAKQQGKSATLLEQHRPNVFQMNVANILPEDVVQVELKYMEWLVSAEGIYEFVYPTVVGPRYSNQPSAGALPSAKWVENPYLHQGQSPTDTFDIKINLAAGLPVQEMVSSSHKVNIRYDGPSRASVYLDPSEKYGGNRDFILRYQLAGGNIESGLLVHEGERENFFLLMLQPPKRVMTGQIPPREYIFIVDVSGSMHGFPIEISKKLLKDLIGNLRVTDRFNLLLFSGGSSLMSEQSLPASSENVRRAIDVIERQKGGGGTELLPALKRALSLPRSEGWSRSVIIATDGYITVEEEVFDLMRKTLGDANMFTFGIGTSVNRYLLEGMARVGMGEPFVIGRIEETEEKADKFRKMIESPVLTGVKVDFGTFDAYGVEPLSIPDVFAERPILVFGKWRGKPSGEITLRGFTGTQPYTRKIDIRKEKPLESNSGLRYLWARHRIALLSDYNFLRNNPERIKEITHLGMTYNLLTAYTSFVAIDTQVRLKDGQAVTVKQPLPLPQGVSDYAVEKGEAVQKAALSPSTPRSDSLSGLNRAAKDSRTEEKPKELEKDSQDRKGRIELGKISISDEQFKKTLQEGLRFKLSTLELCYEKSSDKQTRLKGEVILRVAFDPKGKVLKVDLISSQLNDPPFEQCLIQKIKEMAFSMPGGNKQASAIATITLKLI